ncbi:ABC transporter permease [Streptomyces sp. NBC_00019]|uniref:ABC transporter permease n=1 Tax=Streptomyces sp. NBC_00019 TaxID=2975623 RepID=UPI00324F8C15
MSRYFAGTGDLLRLALRRDRIQLPLWILGLTLVQTATASSISGLYETEKDRIAAQTSAADNPASLVFSGLVSGSSEGATAMTQSLLLVLVAAALMSTLAVVRHTRQNEELGRSELIGSTAVGRHAALTAGLLLAVLANVVLAVVSALGLASAGLPLGSSFAAGAAIGAVGVSFAGVAAITAQIWESARAANGAAAAALGVAFMLRAVGDVAGRTTGGGPRVESAWPSWLSPIGWGQQMRPFDQDRWWVLALPLAAFAVQVGVAFALTRIRDVGMGMRAVQPRSPEAAPALLSPIGLAWFLHRGTLAGWAVGVSVMSFSFGVVGDEINDLIGDSERTAEIIQQLGGTGSLLDAYLSATIGLMGLAVAGFAVQALNRMRHEETSGGMETVLSTSTSRFSWMTGHLVVTLAGVTVLMLLTGISAAVGYGVATGDMGAEFGSLVAAALVRLPAVLVLAAFAVLAFGSLPRLAIGLPWAAFAICLLIGQIGSTLDLPQAVMDISPFSHVPGLPGGDFTVGPLLVLLAITAALTAAGTALFRRRDLALQ